MSVAACVVSFPQLFVIVDYWVVFIPIIIRIEIYPGMEHKEHNGMLQSRRLIIRTVALPAIDCV